MIDQSDQSVAIFSLTDWPIAAKIQILCWNFFIGWALGFPSTSKPPKYLLGTNSDSLNYWASPWSCLFGSCIIIVIVDEWINLFVKRWPFIHSSQLMQMLLLLHQETFHSKSTSKSVLQPLVAILDLMHFGLFKRYFSNAKGDIYSSRISTVISGSGCILAVEHMCHDPKVVGSNLCWVFGFFL